MKYWRGYVMAGIIAAITIGLQQLAKRYTMLIDMFYPYLTRTVQSFLATWSGGVDFTIWQTLAVLAIVALLVVIVLSIVFKWNFFQWVGWVLTAVSLVWMLHTGIYGLNYYAGPLADDIRLTVSEYSEDDLENATIYFRDKANALASELSREENGDLIYPEFEALAQQAGNGFHNLTYQKSGSVFAGSTQPVKKLAWADMYSSMGILGITMPITGESAVNPQIPQVALPFTMCHEMAHRMCIASEEDSNFAAFLSCLANESKEFQYSAYYMAFRYCYSAMVDSGSEKVAAAAARIATEVNAFLRYDLQSYNKFFSSNRDNTASNIASMANDTYIKVSGDKEGITSYSNVANLLVNWYIQEIILPNTQDQTETVFDPTDKDQVDVTDIPRGNN